MTIRNEQIADRLTKLDEKVTKNFPELLYNGSIQADEDEMDYVTISLKGVRIA